MIPIDIYNMAKNTMTFFNNLLFNEDNIHRALNSYSLGDKMPNPEKLNSIKPRPAIADKIKMKNLVTSILGGLVGDADDKLWGWFVFSCNLLNQIFSPDDLKSKI